MPADASIYSLIRPQQSLPNPVEQYGQVMTLKNLMGQQKIQERAIADDESIRSAYQTSGGDPVKLKELLYGKGLYKPAMEVEKYTREKTKSDSDLLKNDSELMAKFNALSKEEYPHLTPENYPAYKELSYKRAGMLSTPQMREAGLKAVQQMPDKFNSKEEFYNYISEKMVKAEDMGAIIASGALPGTPEFAAAFKKKMEGGQGRGDYSVPVYDSEGNLLSFDTRQGGKLTRPLLDGKPIKGAAVSPGLQGKLSEAKKTGEGMATRALDLPQAKLRTDTMTDNLVKLKTAMQELKDDPGISNITGTLFGRTPNITNTATGAQAKLDSIKSQIFVSALQSMREASKTGGAVGNVSDREGDKLEATLSALAQSQGTSDFKNQLDKAIQQIDLANERILRAFKETYPEDKTQPAPAPAVTSSVAPTTSPAAKPTGKIKFLGFE